MLMIEKKGIVEQIDSIARNDKVDKFKAAKFAVENARAIEAEPVRHGYWIECDYKELRHGEIWTEHRAGLCCSECRTGFKKSKMTFKQYCAACGAKMQS